jgi:hypothetical protein
VCLGSVTCRRYANALDTNYDLALLRWGVGVLLHLASTHMPTLKAEPAYAQWQVRGVS